MDWNKFVERTKASYISQIGKFFNGINVPMVEVEDMLQDIYLILASKYGDNGIEELDYIGSKVLHNICMSRIYGRHRDIRNPRVKVVGEVYDNSQTAPNADSACDLDTVLEFMAKYRYEYVYKSKRKNSRKIMKLLLLQAQGYSPAEIARRYHTTPGGVTAYTTQARKILRAEFPEYHSN
jgi:DNA-directed RNA polymerase specialized sigma24 family protein